MATIHIGDLRIDTITEEEKPDVLPSQLLPDSTPEAIEPHLHWLQPRFLDPETGKIVLAFRSYVIRDGRHTILVDTCIGNDKGRKFQADWNVRSSLRYMEELAALGLRPENIDFVLCTHLHADHVGWNTRLVDGRWVPTFPNAKYIFSRQEWEFWEAKNKKGPKYSDGCIDDSVLPVIESGLADIVESDHALNDSLWLEPSPGHTPGHVSLRLRSKGQNAVMSGDVIHTPLQCAFPQWSTAGCFDKELSRTTRRAFLECHCDTDMRILPAHFPSPAMGRVTRRGDAFAYLYCEELS